MKRILMLVIVVSLLTVGASIVNAQSGYDLFQKALVKERAVGDVEEALRLYQRIVKEFGGNHALAAKAQLRMGLLYDRLGRKADAQRAYQAVVNQYGDQTNEARQARAKIVVAPARPRAPRQSTSPAGLSYHVAWKMPGRKTYASSVSPDGRYIAYENWDEGDDLFLHDLATGSDLRLTKAVGANEEAQGESAFSRDGKQLAYGWTNNQRDVELRVIDLQGSGIPQPRRLFIDKDVRWVGPWDWTPDGKWIAVEADRNDRTKQIALISTSDGSLRVLKSFTGSKPWWAPMRFSQDGKYLASDLRTGPSKASAKSDIFVLSIDGGQEIPAVVNPADDELVGWSADGTRLIFTSDRTGSRSLFALPIRDGRPQGEPELIRADVGRLSPLGLTTSGSLYSFEKAGANSDIKVGSFDFSTGEILSPPTDLLLQDFAGANRSPDWSPDGKSLAYIVEHGPRAGDFSLAIRSLETDQVQELRPQLGRVDWLRWARDGRSFVVSASDLKGVSGLWRVDRTTAEVSAIAPGTFSLKTSDWPQLDDRFQGSSSDARKIYYQRSIGGHQTPNQGVILFERDLASGMERELFRRPAQEPGVAGYPGFAMTLSADARKLYYRKSLGVPSPSDTAALQAAFIERDLASGTERELTRGNLGFIYLSPDGQYIATNTADLATKSQSILLVPVAGDAPRTLMPIALPQSVIDQVVLSKDLHGQNALSVLWAPDSRSLLFRHNFVKGKPDLWWVSVDVREPAKLVSLVDDERLWDMRVHPDGRRIAIAAQQPPRPAEVWVLEHVLATAATKKTTASRR